MKHLQRSFSSHRMRASALALCFSLTLGACDLFISPEKLKADANAALAARNFATAAQTAQQWAQKAPEQYEAYFVLAQAQAQAGDKNAAVVALEQALSKGLKDDTQVTTNTNLEPIRSMVAYQKLMDTHFPGHVVKQESKANSGAEAEAEAEPEPNESVESVSITEKDGMQVLRAGDVMIKVPTLK